MRAKVRGNAGRPGDLEVDRLARRDGGVERNLRERAVVRVAVVGRDEPQARGDVDRRAAGAHELQARDIGPAPVVGPAREPRESPPSS